MRAVAGVEYSSLAQDRLRAPATFSCHTRMNCKVTPPPHERIVRSGFASVARRNVQPAALISAILASSSRRFAPANVERNGRYREVCSTFGCCARSNRARRSMRMRGITTTKTNSAVTGRAHSRIIPIWLINVLANRRCRRWPMIQAPGRTCAQSKPHSCSRIPESGGQRPRKRRHVDMTQCLFPFNPSRSSRQFQFAFLIAVPRHHVLRLHPFGHSGQTKITGSGGSRR